MEEWGRYLLLVERRGVYGVDGGEFLRRPQGREMVLLLLEHICALGCLNIACWRSLKDVCLVELAARNGCMQ